MSRSYSIYQVATKNFLERSTEYMHRLGILLEWLRGQCPATMIEKYGLASCLYICWHARCLVICPQPSPAQTLATSCLSVQLLVKAVYYGHVATLAPSLVFPSRSSVYNCPHSAFYLPGRACVHSCAQLLDRLSVHLCPHVLQSLSVQHAPLAQHQQVLVVCTSEVAHAG